ncbi:MAG: acylphosphatase [Halobacillus sp.]|uniref:acylphosphatase n=1 Tax=Halobacillus sp. TaxID=56800 RepID=UPI003BAF8D8F
MERNHLIVHGRVQGVGFRASAKQIADQLDITGWAKNKSDGTVEIDAEGEGRQLKQFIDKINEGPTPFAKVEALDITEKEATNSYESFRTI